MADLIVNVTQEHIDNGFRMSAESCPIALAIRDASGGPGYVDGRWAFYLPSGETRIVRALMPLKAAKFALDFDADDSVSPFIFELNRVSVSAKPEILSTLDSLLSP